MRGSPALARLMGDLPVGDDWICLKRASGAKGFYSLLAWHWQPAARNGWRRGRGIHRHRR